MNHYELLCIISGQKAEAEIGGFEKTIEDMLKSIVSTVHFTHNLDRKKLAFPIDHHAYGYYFLAEFDADPQGIARIERELSLMNDVLRHAITQKKAVGAPPTIAQSSKQAFDALPSITDMPTEVAATPTPIVPTVQTPTQTTSTPVVSTPTPKEEVSAQPIPESIPQEPLTVKATVATVTEEKKEEKEEADGAQHKKKQTKLSYEELDKRLDEIINNDLF